MKLWGINCKEVTNFHQVRLIQIKSNSTLCYRCIERRVVSAFLLNFLWSPFFLCINFATFANSAPIRIHSSLLFSIISGRGLIDMEYRNVNWVDCYCHPNWFIFNRDGSLDSHIFFEMMKSQHPMSSKPCLWTTNQTKWINNNNLSRYW